MTVKHDSWWLKNQYVVQPFVKTQINKDEEGNPLISYGLSSFGYDLRLDYEFTASKHDRDIDPKNTRNEDWHNPYLPISQKHNYIWLPSRSFILAQTLEYIKMPDDCIGICTSKSTYARCGIILSTSPIEPSWEGHITLEIFNANSVAVRLYAGEGILQLVLISGVKPIVNYHSRGGKYQGQQHVTLPKV